MTFRRIVAVVDALDVALCALRGFVSSAASGWAIAPWATIRPNEGDHAQAGVAELPAADGARSDRRDGSEEDEQGGSHRFCE